MARARGFILIDLLVVISIIVLLVSRLLPGLRLARNKGGKNGRQKGDGTSYSCPVRVW